MEKSFVYQETTNNFELTDQKMKGQQMLSIKKFKKLKPDATELPDYPGQLGVGNRDDGTSIVYIGNPGSMTAINGWDTVTAALGDEYVHKDKANNFSNTNQTILDNQITFVSQGLMSIDKVASKGKGHMYIDTSKPDMPKVYITMEHAGGGFDWVQITDHTQIDNIVLKDRQNNFSDGRQTILNQSVASVNPSINRPDVPVRSGEIYMQKGDESKGERAKLWLASSTAMGALKWEPVSHTLDETVVHTNKHNEFSIKEQTILGKQIISFVNGGDQPPSTYRPDYDGQFYIAFKTLSSGERDVAVWVANKNTWVPISSTVKTDGLAVLAEENTFTKETQFIGTKDVKGKITGCRVRTASGTPIADASFKSLMEGEVCVNRNTDTSPMEVTIWLSVSKNPLPTTNAGEWVMIWSSKQDLTRFAAKDEQNTFVAGQKMKAFGDKDMYIVGAQFDWDTTPYGRILPQNIGEIFITDQEEVGGQPDELDVWIATKKADSNSWVKLYNKTISTVARTDEENFFTKPQYLGERNSDKLSQVMGVREQDGTVYGTTSPRRVGEVVLCTEAIDGEDWVVTYIATSGDFTQRKAWIEIGRRKKSDLIIR